MFTIQEYAMPETLQEAYDILKAQRSNVILGGCAWLRLGSRRIRTAVDLSKCGLDFIRENGEFIEIGAMTSYHSVAASDLLKSVFDGVIASCVTSIIGVQFRNTVTVGGSVYGRFGFSDFLTPLLALDTRIVLFNRGEVPLKDFMTMPYEKDIVVMVRIRKDGRRLSYQNMRNSRGDFPILNLAVSYGEAQGFTVTVGARGPKAVRAEKTSAYLTGHCRQKDEALLQGACDLLVSEVSFTDNMRASADYRRLISQVFLKRAVREVTGW